jgi:hypothetical protein
MASIGEVSRIVTADPACRNALLADCSDASRKWIYKGPSPLAEATDEACDEFPQNRAQLDSGKK